MTVGPWVDADNYSWMTGAAVGLIFLPPLALDAFTSYQWTAIVAAGVNIIKAITIFLYNEKALVGAADAGFVYKIYKIADYLSFVIGEVALFKRKRVLVPEQSLKAGPLKLNLDHIVIGSVCVLLTTAKLYCLVFPEKDCWSVDGLVGFSASFISLIYFDAYVIYKLQSVVSDGRVIPLNSRLRLAVPVLWTASLSIMLLSGVLMYQYGVADFYSNAYWNIASVLYPICAVQSFLSTHAAKFLVEAKFSKRNRSVNRFYVAKRLSSSN